MTPYRRSCGADFSALSPQVPEWVGGFLNRRTEVEEVLRKIGAGRRGTLTRAEAKALANKLSVPDEYAAPASAAHEVRA